MNVGLHYNCRNMGYPSKTESVLRLNVPDDKVGWDVQWDDYCPPYYTAKHILNQSWADPELGEDTAFKPVWNQLDGKVNRNSHMGTYMVKDGYPLNPWGRTGLCGRGILGRWGPNHAADPIVTRWKRTNGTIDMGNTNRPILQFIAIKRRDCNEWAIPGGMVDPGEVVTTTLKREFQEEALNTLEMSTLEKIEVEKDLSQFFSTGETVYKGYVDDRRNTDNAWMETVAQNFHDENDLFVGSLNLSAGDDAIGVTWIDLSSHIQLYASHSQFLKIVAEKRAAHW